MVRCYFCRKTMIDVPAAIEADWIPGFYRTEHGDDEVFEPVCPTCTANHLGTDADGCYFFRPAHADAEPFVVAAR